ncbi:HMG-Y-related protein A [Quillaja saponaria]|uniref:HMG-Y-related protein A n=1 Tax=Quillaja saponaria TaxID=32244 RepID=A0AAD7Q5L9_QUISA|nr:HMG-Y-related protein A [Quillaja saponaria]
MDSAPIPTVTDAAPIISTVPATTPTVFPVEVNNHIAHAANATPNDAPTANHPPYAEMISTAITALKEKNGSSKKAIAKYIERVYTGLPSTHSALLTHHLKRLKNNGLLVMVKKSYQLPRSRSDPFPSQRGRGRPPKPKLQPQPQPQPQPVPVANVGQNSDQLLVSLGLMDEPTVVKRSPGRPKKTDAAGRPPGPKVGPGRSRLSKRPGRPPKPKSVSTISNGLKRRPGRPFKAQPVVIPFSVPADGAPAVPNSSVPGVPVVPNVPADSVPPKPRGRPKKNATAVPVPAAGAGPETTDNTAGVSRGRGRGRRVSSRKQQGGAAKIGGISTPKSPTGRSVGRPKKNAPSTTASAPDSPLVIHDLRRKLDYFQSMN